MLSLTKRDFFASLENEKIHYGSVVIPENKSKVQSKIQFKEFDVPFQSMPAKVIGVSKAPAKVFGLNYLPFPFCPVPLPAPFKNVFVVPVNSDSNVTDDILTQKLEERRVNRILDLELTKRRKTHNIILKFDL